MKKVIFVLSFSLLIGIGLFSQTEEGPIKIWGWSKDGKVGISEFNGTHGRIRAMIINTVDDKILWEKPCPGYYYYEDETEKKAFEKAYSELINEFQNVCKQQYGIELQEMDAIAPSELSNTHSGTNLITSITISEIQYNGKTYNITVIQQSKGEESGGYTIIAEVDGKKKTIFSTGEIKGFWHYSTTFFRYCISPHGDRALIVIKNWTLFAEESWSYRYIGCHLSSGFR